MQLQSSACAVRQATITTRPGVITINRKSHKAIHVNKKTVEYTYVSTSRRYPIYISDQSPVIEIVDSGDGYLSPDWKQKIVLLYASCYNKRKY